MLLQPGETILSRDTYLGPTWTMTFNTKICVIEAKSRENMRSDDDLLWLTAKEVIKANVFRLIVEQSVNQFQPTMPIKNPLHTFSDIKLFWRWKGTSNSTYSSFYPLSPLQPAFRQTITCNFFPLFPQPQPFFQMDFQTELKTAGSLVCN